MTESNVQTNRPPQLRLPDASVNRDIDREVDQALSRIYDVPSRWGRRLATNLGLGIDTIMLTRIRNGSGCTWDPCFAYFGTSYYKAEQFHWIK